MVLHSVSETETPAAREPPAAAAPPPPVASSVLSSKPQPLRSFAFSNFKWPLDHSTTTTNHHYRFRNRLAQSTRHSERRANYRTAVNENHRHRVVGKLVESTLPAGSEPRLASPLKYDHHWVSKFVGSTWKSSESGNRNDPGRDGVKNGLSSVGASERLVEKEAKKISEKKSANFGSVIEKPEDKSTASDPKSKIYIRIRTKDKSSAADDDGTAEAPDQTSSVAAEFEEPAPKTWNLRPRKPAPKHPNSDGLGGASRSGGVAAQETKTQPPGHAESARARNGTDTKVSEKRPRLSIALSREEIEEDIFVFTGSKPARRPKKRAKNVQKQLDCVFPGLWLGSITPESYRVSHAPGKV